MGTTRCGRIGGFEIPGPEWTQNSWDMNHGFDTGVTWDPEVLVKLTYFSVLSTSDFRTLQSHFFVVTNLVCLPSREGFDTNTL